MKITNQSNQQKQNNQKYPGAVATANIGAATTVALIFFGRAKHIAKHFLPP